MFFIFSSYDSWLYFWTDVASRLDKKPEVDMEYKTDYMYCWMDYDYNLFNGDFGSVSIKPTIRVLNKKQDDSNYTRMKFELTTDIKFK